MKIAQLESGHACRLIHKVLPSVDKYAERAAIFVVLLFSFLLFLVAHGLIAYFDDCFSVIVVTPKLEFLTARETHDRI